MIHGHKAGIELRIKRGHYRRADVLSAGTLDREKIEKKPSWDMKLLAINTNHENDNILRSDANPTIPGQKKRIGAPGITSSNADKKRRQRVNDSAVDCTCLDQKVTSSSAEWKMRFL